MRLSHLLGLVSLIGLVLAAPMARTAPVDVVEGGQLVGESLAAVYAWRYGTRRTYIELDALDICVLLPPGVKHKVGYIIQTEGLVCNYYESESQCSGEFSTLDSRGEEKKGFVPQANEAKISAVWCVKKEKSTGEMTDASTTLEISPLEAPAIYARAIDATLDTQSPPPLDVGDVMFCGETHCTFLHSSDNQCATIPGNYIGHIAQIKQGKGAHCKYYESLTCSPAAIIHESTFKPDLVTTIVGAIKNIAGFSCAPTASPPKVPGDVVFCKSEPAPGTCSQITALGKCTPLEASLSHQATKITQIAGAYCRYYADCGGKFVFDARTRSGDGNYIVNEVVPRVGGVYCELEAKAAQLLETTQTLDANPASLVKRGTAELAHALYGSTNTVGENRLNVRAFNAPGDTIVCHGKDYTYCHENRINAIKQCANFNPNHTGPASLKQYQGAFCKYFGDFGCANDDSPLIVDSTEVTVEIPRLGTEDRNRLKSVKCETHAW